MATQLLSVEGAAIDAIHSRRGLLDLDFSDLKARGVLVKEEWGGRSTSYSLARLDGHVPRRA